MHLFLIKKKIWNSRKLKVLKELKQAKIIQPIMFKILDT
jgi:hypothetical protein